MFRAGQKVVCVDAKPRWPWPTITNLVKGEIYTIHKAWSDYSGEAVLLVEVELPNNGTTGWYTDRFRPVTDISELEKLLIQAPVKVKEPV